MSTLYSIGAMNQLGDALEQAGFFPADVTLLKQFKNLSSIKDLLQNQAQIVYREFSIDTNHLPVFPDEYSVVDHQKNGELLLSKDRLETLFLPKQNQEEGMLGAEILGLLSSKQKLNVAVADFLLKNSHTIPDSWRPYCVCFWGTLIKKPNNDPAVLYILWSGRDWDWGVRALKEKFDHNYPAAILLDKS